MIHLPGRELSPDSASLGKNQSVMGGRQIKFTEEPIGRGWTNDDILLSILRKAGFTLCGLALVAELADENECAECLR